MTSDEAELCAVVLAAGAGSRLSPLTDLRPKALCPVGRRTLLDRTMDRLASLGFTGPDVVAINAHHHADQIIQAAGHRAHVNVEQPEALGTAGAIAALSDWIDGRDVLICNADAYLADAEVVLTEDWSGDKPRLLAMADPARADFGEWRFAGMSLLPAATAATLKPVPSGLYELVWRKAWAESTLELAPFEGFFVDCGTPSDYLLANLHATGGGSAVGAGAVIEGRITRSVVWPGGYVGPDEQLTEVIRVGRDITVPAPLSALRGHQLPRDGGPRAQTGE
jgi:MurNAc alpha-1-phosphate uridylyltransferase